MNTRFRAAAVFLACALVTAGCGGGKKLYPVEGTVTIDGEPLEGAMVIFTSGDSTSAAGITSASGKFKLLTDGKEGAPAGTYKVTVTKKKTVQPTSATTGGVADPTKTYTEWMKANNMKMGPKGMEVPKVKPEIPERYGNTGALPDQVIPSSGPIEIELKSK
jgi:hypothetical protein